jgi:hypothetical protein
LAGSYDTEEAAARTYDLAALKYWGSDYCGILNFPVSSALQERLCLQCTLSCYSEMQRNSQLRLCCDKFIQVETYKQELEMMQRVTRQEYLAQLRRNSCGFARGASKYRGVAR